MKHAPYHALPFLTPSEQATFTRIMNMLRARKYATVDAVAPWDRAEYRERLHPVGRRTSQVARVLKMVRAVAP